MAKSTLPKLPDFPLVEPVCPFIVGQKVVIKDNGKDAVVTHIDTPFGVHVRWTADDGVECFDGLGTDQIAPIEDESK